MSTVTALRRRALVGAAIAGLAAATLVALPASRAEAHGGLTYPQTRTYACYLDGLAGGQAAGQAGNMLPTNPICQQALAASNYPFYNWYGNLLGTIAGKAFQIFAGVMVTLYWRRIAPHVFLAASVIYLWAAWHNVWGRHLYPAGLYAWMW